VTAAWGPAAHSNCRHSAHLVESSCYWNLPLLPSTRGHSAIDSIEVDCARPAQQLVEKSLKVYQACLTTPDVNQILEVSESYSAAAVGFS
jgi:hypothetical protein